MRLIGSALLLCCALGLIAQVPCPPKQIQPLQVKLCPHDANWHALPCTFDLPLTAGSLRIATGKGGCDPALPFPGNCDSVSDSQGNVWKTAMIVPYYNGVPLWFALGGPAGIDTVNFRVAQFGIIAEYPPSTGLQDVNYGTYAGQNVHVPQGSSYDDHVTLPVETEESCELLISWDYLGALDGPWVPTAGPDFTLRAYEYGGFALEDRTTNVPGLYVGAMKWNTAAHWVMGSVVFKTGGCK